MAKMLMSADWHIKIGQKNVPREWQKARFIRMYDLMHKMCIDEKVDGHVIMGDIFDTVCSLEELALFATFLHILW